MYTPKKFKVTDLETIRSFVDQNGFGTIISTTSEGEIETTQTPMFLSDETTFVYGHIAKANPQWKSWMSGRKVRILFNGPHTYISPRDYTSLENVPTWNYTAVVIDGQIEIVEDEKEQEVLIDTLVAQYESSADVPWQLDKGNSKLTNMLKAIVCFRIDVEQIEAKFKLNQNKSIEDQQSVINHLKGRTSDSDRAIAGLMQANQDKTG